MLPLALLLVLLTATFAEPRQDVLVVQVVSAVSGDPVQGALVIVGDRRYLGDEDGKVRVSRPVEEADIGVEVDGFGRVDGPSRPIGGVLVIQMQPALVRGVVRDMTTGNPIPGADVVLVDGAGAPLATLRTDSHGAFIFKDIPGNASIRANAAGYDRDSIPVATRQRIDIALVPASAMQTNGSRVWTSMRVVAIGLPGMIEGGG